MDFAKFVDLLETGCLKLTRANKFPDKFEGSFTPTIKKAIEKAYADNNIKCSYRHFKSELRNNVYISCWQNSTKDSMAMWQLYGQSNCGIAVTTTVPRIHRAIMESKYHNSAYIRRVNYIDHSADPEIDIQPYSTVFSYKHDAFEYEKEVRIILDRFDLGFNKENNVEVIALQVDLPHFLSGIFVSPSAPEWFRELLKKVIKKYAFDFEVERSQLSMEPI